jgi:hypothetical protein
MHAISLRAHMPVDSAVAAETRLEQRLKAQIAWEKSKMERLQVDVASF